MGTVHLLVSLNDLDEQGNLYIDISFNNFILICRCNLSALDGSGGFSLRHGCYASLQLMVIEGLEREMEEGIL